MTPVPRNIEIKPSSGAHQADPIVDWTRSKVSLDPIELRQPDDLASHLLTTAFNNIVSLKGHFLRTSEISRSIPEHAHIVIMPVIGTALIQTRHSTQLLEQGNTVMISGPQHLKLAISSTKFHFLAATILNTELTSLAQSNTIDLKPGETKLVLNSEVITPSSSQEKSNNSAPMKSAFLLNMLIASAPPASTEDSFAPKIPATLRPFRGVLADIWNNPNQDWNLVNCAKAAQYSQFHFSRLFRSEFQMGFREYVTECRIRHAANLICNGNLTAQQVMAEAGFNRASTFRSSLRTTLGFSRAELAQYSNQMKTL